MKNIYFKFEVKKLKFSTPKLQYNTDKIQLQYYPTYTDKQKVNMSVLTVAGHRFNVFFLFTVFV